MLRLLVWLIIGFIFYVLFKVVKFVAKVNYTLNKSSQNTMRGSNPAQKKNHADIIEADYVEIESEIHKRTENK